MTEETKEENFPDIVKMTSRQKILNALFRAQMDGERVTLGSLNRRLNETKPEWLPVLQQMEDNGEIIATKNPDRRGSIWVHPSNLLHSEYKPEHRRECAYLSEIKNTAILGEATTLKPAGRGVITDFLTGQDAFDYMHEKIIDEIQDFGWISYKRAQKLLVKFPIQSQVFDHFWKRMTGPFFPEYWHINSIVPVEGETDQYRLHTDQTLKSLAGSPLQFAIYTFVDISNREHDNNEVASWLEEIQEAGGFSYPIVSKHLKVPEIKDRTTRAENLETDVDDPLLIAVKHIREDRRILAGVLRDLLNDERTTMLERLWEE